MECRFLVLFLLILLTTQNGYLQITIRAENDAAIDDFFGRSGHTNNWAVLVRD